MLSQELQIKKLEVEVAESQEKIRELENELKRRASIFGNMDSNYNQNVLFYITNKLSNRIKDCGDNETFRTVSNLEESLRNYMYNFEISKAKYISENSLQNIFRRGIYLIDAKSGISIEKIYQRAILDVLSNIDLAYGSRNITECIEIFKQRDIRIENLEYAMGDINLDWIKINIDEKCNQIKIKENELSENILKNIFKDLFINYIKFSKLDYEEPAILNVTLNEESFNIDMSFKTNNDNSIGLDTIYRMRDVINDINNNGKDNVSYLLENGSCNINIAFNKNLLYKKPWR